jgi:hypothetical protein
LGIDWGERIWEDGKLDLIVNYHNLNITSTLFYSVKNPMEREEMPVKEDTLFYAGYGFVIIMLGLMILFYSMGAIGGWTAFGLWLLSMSLVLVGLGSVRTETAPSGSRTLIGFGLFFAVISMAILGIILELVSPLAAFAGIILLMGIGILVLGMRRDKSKS